MKRCAAILAALALSACEPTNPNPGTETNAQLSEDLLHAGDLIGEHDRRISALEVQVRELESENAALRQKLGSP